MGYQLKITIKNSRPPIWRRIIVPEHITFVDLDNIIEAAFGWTHDHMFAFKFGNWEEEFVGTPFGSDEDTADVCIDPWMEEGISFSYIYDFGDDWVHTIKVEKIVPYEERYPQVTKYKGPNMIEDCGGIWGFYEYIDEAEPFDMEAVNEKFRTWNLAETYPEADDDWMTDDDEYREAMEMFGKLLSGLTGEDEESQKEIEGLMEAMKIHEDNLRETVPPLLSLEDVFMCYTKEDLKYIAKMHGFTGYNKFKKNELAQWLKNHLLETVFMKEILLKASEDELNLFEKAIKENGIIMNEDIISRYFLLGTYGGYNSELEFYRVPVDVQEKYEKICTPEFKKECAIGHRFLAYCDSAVFLYGVIPVKKFVEIYNSYEDTDMDIKEAGQRIKELIDRGEPYALREGLLMDEDLLEEDLFRFIMEIQAPFFYYIPEDKEEFIKYGQTDSQAPDEKTQFFIDYLHKKFHKKSPEDMMIFMQIQDGIRMNADVEELIEALARWGCKISSQKQILEAEKQILRLSNYIRKWDYKGHTAEETRQKDKKIIQFPGGRKIYPNDACPCGSGKKYKHCCGKNK